MQFAITTGKREMRLTKSIFGLLLVFGIVLSCMGSSLYNIKTCNLTDTKCHLPSWQQDLTNKTISFAALGSCNNAWWVRADDGVKSALDKAWLWPKSLQSYHGFLYASIGAELFKTTDGVKWFKTVISNEIAISGIATLHVYADYLYVSTSQGIFRTKDDGKKWRLIKQGLPEGAVATHLYSHHHVLYAGTNYGVFQWQERTNSWSQLVARLDNRPITALCYYNNHLYVGTTKGLFKIDPATLKVQSVQEMDQSQVWDLCAYQDSLYAIVKDAVVTEDDLFSQDGTVMVCNNVGHEAWRPLPNCGMNRVIAMSSHDGVLSLIFDQGEIMETTDNWSWAFVGRGEHNSDVSLRKGDFTAVGWHNGSLYLIADKNIWKRSWIGAATNTAVVHEGGKINTFSAVDNSYTANISDEWIKIKPALDTNNQIIDDHRRDDFSLDARYLFTHQQWLHMIANDGRHFKSSDNGANWRLVQEAIPGGRDYHKIIVHHDQTYIYAATITYGSGISSTTRIWRALIAGGAWEGLDIYNLDSARAMVAYKGTLYLGDFNRFFKYGSSGKLESVDFADNQDSPFYSRRIQSLVVYQDILYAFKENGKIFTTHDGVVWSEAKFGHGYGIETASNGNYLYVHTKYGYGCYSSSDGKNWLKVEHAVLNKNVNYLHEHQGYLYAVTAQGLFRSKARLDGHENDKV